MDDEFCSYDAGIICHGKYRITYYTILIKSVHNIYSHADDLPLLSNCTDYDVRLRHGSLPNRGTLQVCINRVWGDVCIGGIGYRAAEVICNQLGYQRRGK